MLIKEETIKQSLLYNIPYIDNQFLDESVIPVTENSRLGKYIISVEDISSFCENSEKDPGYVISRICESNNISANDIAFSVTEESIILEDEVAENAMYLMNEGAEVLAKPVIHDDLYDIIEEECKQSVYDKRAVSEVSQDFVNKMLGVDYVPDVQIGNSFMKGGPEKEYKGRANKWTVRMAASKYKKNFLRTSKKDDIPEYIKLMQHGKRYMDLHRENNKKNRFRDRKYEKNKREQDEEKAWNIHDYGDPYYTNFDFDMKKDREMAKGFKEIRDNEPLNHTIDKMDDNERFKLGNEIWNGTDAIQQMNDQDELDRYQAQMDMKTRLKKQKLDKELEEEKKRSEQTKADNERIRKLNIETKKAARSNNRSFIAKVIARLNAIARKYRDKYKNVKVNGPKTAIQRILAFIAKCVAMLTAKLHSLSKHFR